MKEPSINAQKRTVKKGGTIMTIKEDFNDFGI
jgi:hypothetical protein